MSQACGVNLPRLRERRTDCSPVYRELLYCYGRRIGLKGIVVWSYIRLHQHGGSIWKELTGYAWTSRETMGRDLGIADTRTLRDAIQALKEADLLIEVRAGDLFDEAQRKALQRAGQQAEVPLHIQPNSRLLMVHDPLTREEFVRWDQGRECQTCAHGRNCPAYRSWLRGELPATGGGEFPPPDDQDARNVGPPAAAPTGGGISAGGGGGRFPPKPNRVEPEKNTLSLFESQRGPQSGPQARSDPSLVPSADQEKAASPGGPAVPDQGALEDTLAERYERVLADLRRFAGMRRKQVAIVVQNLAALVGFGEGRKLPQRSEYGRVGALVKRFGAEAVWLTAVRLAGRELDGDPLAYLQRCLESAQAETATSHPDPPATEEASPLQVRPLPVPGAGRQGLGHLVHGAGRFRPYQPPERSTYLTNLVVDIGRQFGDIEHFRENDAQAHNLWWASGLEEGPFVQLVYQARQRALRLAGARNRMAYFFAVLRNLALPDAAGGREDDRGMP